MLCTQPAGLNSLRRGVEVDQDPIFLSPRSRSKTNEFQEDWVLLGTPEIHSDVLFPVPSGCVFGKASSHW